MQDSFQLTPLTVKSGTYYWETGSWEDDKASRYAVVYNSSKIIAIFDSRHWAERFVEQNKLAFEIMKVAE